MAKPPFESVVTGHGATVLRVVRAVLGSVYAPRTTEVRARLGLAAKLSSMNRTADAIAQLKRVVDMQPTEPIGARAQAERELRAAIARSTRH